VIETPGHSPGGVAFLAGELFLAAIPYSSKVLVAVTFHIVPKQI